VVLVVGLSEHVAQLCTAADTNPRRVSRSLLLFRVRVGAAECRSVRRRMRFPIGRSTEDVAVLLKTMHGDHQQSRSSVVAAVAIVLICISVLPSLSGTFADAQSLQDRITGWIIIALCTVVPLVMLSETLATFHVNESGVTKRYPLRAISKHIGRGDIREIDLELEKGWHLMLAPDHRGRLITETVGAR
jgi:hypothetical protein